MNIKNATFEYGIIARLVPSDSVRGAESLALNASMTVEKELDEAEWSELGSLLRHFAVPQSWRYMRPEEQSSFQEMRNDIRMSSDNRATATA